MQEAYLAVFQGRGMGSDEIAGQPITLLTDDEDNVELLRIGHEEQKPEPKPAPEKKNITPFEKREPAIRTG